MATKEETFFFPNQITDQVLVFLEYPWHSGVLESPGLQDRPYDPKTLLYCLLKITSGGKMGKEDKNCVCYLGTSTFCWHLSDTDISVDGVTVPYSPFIVYLCAGVFVCIHAHAYM